MYDWGGGLLYSMRGNIFHEMSSSGLHDNLKIFYLIVLTT